MCNSNTSPSIILATTATTPIQTPAAPVFSNAQFAYDGDGKRVKSVMNTNLATTTTYFIGAHYIIPVGDIIPVGGEVRAGTAHCQKT